MNFRCVEIYFNTHCKIFQNFLKRDFCKEIFILNWFQYQKTLFFGKKLDLRFNRFQKILKYFKKF